MGINPYFSNQDAVHRQNLRFQCIWISSRTV